MAWRTTYIVCHLPWTPSHTNIALGVILKGNTGWVNSITARGRPVHPVGVPSPHTTQNFFFFFFGEVNISGPTPIVTWNLEALIFSLQTSRAGPPWPLLKKPTISPKTHHFSKKKTTSSPKTHLSLRHFLVHRFTSFRPAELTSSKIDVWLFAQRPAVRSAAGERIEAPKLPSEQAGRRETNKKRFGFSRWKK